MGPMTGRAAGYCAGYAVPGFMNPYGGYGGGAWGRGMRGGGRGRRNWYYATGLPGSARAAQGLPAWGGVAGGYAPPAYGPYAPPPEDELASLKAQSEAIGQELQRINERIAELSKEAGKE